MVVNRISGLSSGIDYDSIIKKMMDAQRVPMNKLKQQVQLLEWKRDNYRELNNKILDFRNAAFNMQLESTYLSKKVSSSQEDIVSVTGTPSANIGQYTIQVERLAKAPNLTSGDLAGAPGVDKTMNTLGVTADTLLTVGGEKGTAVIQVKKTDKISDLVSKINNEAQLTGVRVAYDATMDRLFFSTSKAGDNSHITLQMQGTERDEDDNPVDLLGVVFGFTGTDSQKGNGQIVTGARKFESGNELIDKTMEGSQKFKISVEGDTVHEYAVSSTTTVNQLIAQINSDSGQSGISAYLNADGKLAFMNPESKALSFSDTSNSGMELQEKLGFNGSQQETNNLDISGKTISGQSAKVYFNDIEAYYDSNTFTIAELTFTAKQESTTVVNVGVAQDTEAVYNNIKSFVDKYNELIKLVNGKLSEKKNRDFLPLTDEQRKEMKDTEIEQWEAKAKSGMLANDDILTRGMYNFRNALSDIVSGLPIGQMRSLAEIGISSALIQGTTVRGAPEENGMLHIDEAKLKEAITNNPDEVMALFRMDDNIKDSSAGDGVAVKLYERATALMTQITEKAGVTGAANDRFLLGKELDNYNKRMSDLTSRLELMEARYYKQFTAMETYLNRMNAQSAWLAQQFSTGG